MVTNLCDMYYVKYLISILHSTLLRIQELSHIFLCVTQNTGRLSNIPSILWPEGGGGGVATHVLSVCSQPRVFSS